MKYRKRPVVIDAVQWTGSNLRDVIALTGLHPSAKRWTWDEYEKVVENEGLKIFTLEGVMSASVGDWIIKGVQGECYPCRNDIFIETYEPAEDNSEPQQRDEGAYAEGACSPSVTSRWDGETLIWTIEGIEILDSDLKAWCMSHMPHQWQKPHDGVIRKYHTTAWWQAWKRGIIRR